MTRPSRHDYYTTMLELVAARSTCGRRSVGAIITTVDGEILSTGYNGPPRGFDHCIDKPCPGRNDEPGNTSRCEAVHAEVNAILQCKRLDLADIIYVSCTPCFTCAKMICNTPIKKVIVMERYADIMGQAMLDHAGIETTVFE